MEIEVEERWWKNGGPPGIAGCSGQLGLAQRAQRAGKIGEEGDLTCMFA